MKLFAKILIIIILVFLFIVGIIYFLILRVDLVGYRDPGAVEASYNRMNNILLTAEYSNGTDYYKIELLDSINIEITSNDKAVIVSVSSEYRLSGDTIIILDTLSNTEKYIKSNKMVIINDSILYLIDKNRNFDTIHSMKILLNKLKL